MSSCKDFFEEKALNLIAQQANLRAKKVGVVKFSTGSGIYDSDEVTLDKELFIDFLKKVQIYGMDDVINNIDLILVYYQSLHTIKNFSNSDE